MRKGRCRQTATIGSVLALALALSTAPVHAQPAAPEPPVPTAGPTSFPVKFQSSEPGVMMIVDGPGLPAPARCFDVCTLSVAGGSYSLRIHGAGRQWTMPVTVSGPAHVVVDVPNKTARVLGIGFAVVGGGLVSASVLFVGLTFMVCGMGELLSGLGAGCNLEPLAEEVPYLAAVSGVGLAAGAIGLGVSAATQNPSIELQRAEARAPRAPRRFDTARNQLRFDPPSTGLSLRVSL